MALIRRFEKKHMDRNSLHEEIEATYTVFERDGRKLIQVDSYGRDDRAIPGKKSQPSNSIVRARRHFSKY